MGLESFASPPHAKRITKWLEGSPELVIEVKSPGNSKAELHDKAMTTLAGSGSVEFWIVDPPAQTVTVYTKTSGVHPLSGVRELFARILAG